VLWLLALFAGSQFALSWLVETGTPYLRDPEFHMRLARLRARRAEHPGRRWVVALGSSRMVMGVRPGALDLPNGRPEDPLMFNGGLIGSGPVMQCLDLDRLLRHGVRPDFVLIEFWPPYFVESPGHYEEDRIDSSRVDRGDLALLTRYSRNPARFEDCWSRTRVLPTYGHRLALMNVLRPAWLPPYQRQDYRWAWIDDWGWKPSDDRPIDLSEKPARVAAAQREFIPLLATAFPGIVPVRAFADLLATCRHERIPAAVVWLPEGSEFRSWYQPVTEWWAKKLFASCGTVPGVRLIDARRWAPDEHLLDSFHLAPDGATAFTHRLWPVVRALAAEGGGSGP
jgi:hypothetical protein